MEREIIRVLCNTISLYGGKDDIISIIKDLGDDEKKMDAIKRLIEWNYHKTDEIKDRLSRCSGNSVTITHLN